MPTFLHSCPLPSYFLIFKNIHVYPLPAIALAQARRARLVPRFLFPLFSFLFPIFYFLFLIPSSPFRQLGSSYRYALCHVPQKQKGPQTVTAQDKYLL